MASFRQKHNACDLSEVDRGGGNEGLQTYDLSEVTHSGTSERSYVCSKACPTNSTTSERSHTPKAILATLLFLLLSFPLTHAQTPSWKIKKVDVSGISSPKWEKRIQSSLKGTKDSLAVAMTSGVWTNRLAFNGWLEASVENIAYKNPRLQVGFYQGPRYMYNSLELKGLGENYFTKSSLDKIAYGDPVDWERLNARMDFCIDQLQNEGFPFAGFDSLQVDYQKAGSDTILADVGYTFDPGPFVKIDSIRIKGNKRETDGFVYALIRLKPGEGYNQKAIDDIPRVLNNSIYYQKVQKPVVGFTPQGTAELTVNLERKRAGKFDLLLGILPSSDPNDRRFQVTGLVDLVFVSPLQMGEVIQLKYSKLTAQSREIRMKAAMPYILNTPFKVEGSFSLFNQDTAFSNRILEAAAYYPLSPYLSVGATFRSKNTFLNDENLLALDTTNIPEILSGKNTTYGAVLEFETLDYRLNPTKGILARTSFSLGKRTVRPQARYLKPEVLEQIQTELPTQEVDVEAHWYKQIAPRHVIHAANRTYWLGQDQYYQNDLLQVGGGKSIRGFDENQFFTNFYTFFTLEYRLILERNSYIFAFGDYAYLENAVTNTVVRPMGFGFGLLFDTKAAGIVSITYGVGQAGDIRFRPSRGKLHIGLVNQF